MAGHDPDWVEATTIEIMPAIIMEKRGPIESIGPRTTQANKRMKSDHVMTSTAPDERVETMKRTGGNQLKLKPLGNLLFNPSQRVTRTRGLGGLARLPDELLLTLFSHGAFEARDLTRCRAVSKAFLGWVNLDSLWKLFYIKVHS